MEIEAEGPSRSKQFMKQAIALSRQMGHRNNSKLDEKSDDLPNTEETKEAWFRS